MKWTITDTGESLLWQTVFGEGEVEPRPPYIVGYRVRGRELLRVEHADTLLSLVMVRCPAEPEEVVRFRDIFLALEQMESLDSLDLDGQIEVALRLMGK